MKLTDLFRAIRFIQLLHAVEVGLIRLKFGKKGDSVSFSGIVVQYEGKRYEIKGVIVRLDD
ncbi:MAG: hypothetical protein QXH03_11395 [Candidatus Bathyarchaeia archaeon]